MTDCVEYLTLAETASLLRVKPETIRDRMRRGIFRAGVHYFHPRGSRPLFKRSAIVAWLEGAADASKVKDTGGIRMSKGYLLGGQP
jgi:Helix-turn-helix domain